LRACRSTLEDPTYQLKDRVIRFAKVKVLMPDEAEPSAGDASSWQDRKDFF